MTDYVLYVSQTLKLADHSAIQFNLSICCMENGEKVWSFTCWFAPEWFTKKLLKTKHNKFSCIPLETCWERTKNCLLWILLRRCDWKIHTYTRHWSLQYLRQNYHLASHTTYSVCVNFINECRDLQFKVNCERHIFEKLFMAIFVYSQSLCKKSAERQP